MPFGHDALGSSSLRIIMPKPATLDLGGIRAKHTPFGSARSGLPQRSAPSTRRRRAMQALLALGALSAIGPGAQAVDGCTVLLCLAAPKWSAIPPCVAPVRALFLSLIHI